MINSFQFHSIRSIIIAKLKTKTNQRTEVCEYRIDASSDGNLMPIRMLKVLYPNTKLIDLNKSVDKRVMFQNKIMHAYHKWE